MLNIETRKYKIISQIANLDKTYQIQQIEEFLKKVFSDVKNRNQDIFKPIKKDINVEDMVKEQNYKGINRVTFNELIDEIDLKEPLEYLLDID